MIPCRREKFLILAPIAGAALRQVLDWGVDAIATTPTPRGMDIAT